MSIKLSPTKIVDEMLPGERSAALSTITQEIVALPSAVRKGKVINASLSIGNFELRI